MSGPRNHRAARTTGVKRVLSSTVVGGLAVLILLLPDYAVGQGGPPLITDDPDTPGPGVWEINLATIVERSLSQRRLEEPLADINYGVGRRIQLKFEIPWLRVREGRRSVGTGPGNALYGVKWRFLGQEGKRVAWSIYPQLEVNSSKSMSAKDLVTERPQFFLPTEFTIQFGHFELNGETGRNFVRQGDDEWRFGLSTEVETHLGLELLGEVHGETITHSPTEVIVNLGGRQTITRQLVLLAAAGTAVHGSHEAQVRLRLFLGLQMNLPGRYPFNSFRNR
jgi:hypothetical protein